jgi:hypothetical protein
MSIPELASLSLTLALDVHFVNPTPVYLGVDNV